MKANVPPRLAAPARLAMAAVLLILVSGCSALPSHPDVATTAPPLTEVESADRAAPFDCSIVAPISGAAGLLELPVGKVTELPPFTGDIPSTQGAVSMAMSREAMHGAGQIDCRYGPVGRATDGPEVAVSILPNAADGFISGQPALTEESPELQPSDINDGALLGCQRGERGRCRAEILAGDSWISISVTAPDLDRVPFNAYVRSVVSAVGPLGSVRSATRPRPECAVLLSPRDLTNAAGPLEAAADTSSVERPALARAGEVRGGLVRCGWSSTSHTQSTRVTLTMVPVTAGTWASMSALAQFSTGGLPALDPTTFPEAQWPSSAPDLRGTCTANGCEVTAIAAGVWFTVAISGSGPKGIAPAVNLAAAAYTRYVASI